MRWLDLYCGAGLVADGLIAAGDEVRWGVDIRHQSNYPGMNFLKMDAREFFRTGSLDVVGDMFDAIWASPPCLRNTTMKHAPGAKGDAHPELIAPTREWLKATGLPYVIENVPGAPLIDPISLNGAMFGLGVDVGGVRYHLKRERWFETDWPLTLPPWQKLGKPVVTVIGGHARVRSASAGGRGTADFVGAEGGHRRVMGRAMGLPDDRQVTCAGISDGIPPVYATWIARKLHEYLYPDFA